MTEIDYSKYPKTYLHCFIAECNKKETCAHYIASQHLRKDDVMGNAVFPRALQSNDGCKYYKQLKTFTAAWGFDKLFENVKYKDMSAIRKAIKEYLGGNGTYSRYKRGERLLTPVQQNWIINLLKNYGYTENLQFDHYADTVDW